VYGSSFTREPDVSDRYALKLQRLADRALSVPSAEEEASKDTLARAAAHRRTILPEGEYQHKTYADVRLVATDTLTGPILRAMWVASYTHHLVTADSLGAEIVVQPPVLYQNGSFHSKTVLSSAALKGLETVAPFLACMVQALRAAVAKAMSQEYGDVKPESAYCVLLLFHQGWIARHSDRKPASTSKLNLPERGWERLILTMSKDPDAPPKNLIFDRSQGGETREAFAVTQLSGGVTVTSSLLRGEDKLSDGGRYEHMHDNRGDHISIVLNVPSGMGLADLTWVCRAVLAEMQTYTSKQGGLEAMEKVPSIQHAHAPPLYHPQTSYKCFAYRLALRVYKPWRLRRSSIRTGFLLGEPPSTTR
jgi:hypothetical protein